MTDDNSAEGQHTRHWPTRTLTLTAATVLLGSFLWYELTPPIRDVAADWTSHREVAHALGLWQGLAYTNSLEALLDSREKGFRVFEVDLEFTLDDVLVATHGWPDGPMSLEEFREAALAQGFTSLTFQELMGVFAGWQEFFLILDTKGNATSVWREVERIARTELPDSLERLIPQLYQPLRRDVVETAAFERVLLTLYKSMAPDWFVLHFLRNSGIDVVTAPPSRLTEGFLSRLTDMGVRVYTHTINDRDLADTLFARGIHGLYSDSLCCFTSGHSWGSGGAAGPRSSLRANHHPCATGT